MIVIYAYLRPENSGEYTVTVNSYYSEAEPNVKLQANRAINYTYSKGDYVPTEFDEMADIKEH